MPAGLGGLLAARVKLPSMAWKLRGAPSLLVLSLLAGCVSDGSLREPQAVAGKLGFTLPASAGKVRGYADGFQDWVYEVEFELPSSDLEAFAAELEMDLASEDQPPYFAGNFWTPVQGEAVAWGKKVTSGPNRNWTLAAYSLGPESRRVRIRVFDF